MAVTTLPYDISTGAGKAVQRLPYDPNTAKSPDMLASGTGNVLANNLTNMNDPNQTNTDNPVAAGLKMFKAQSDNSGDPASPIFKAPDKFSYDAASDPQYQSALSLAKQNIQTEQGNTLANLVSHGQGNSSYSAGAVAGVADRAIGNLNNNLLPQFIKEAYNHYQDTIKNNYQTALANYNASQDKIKNNQWDQTFGAGRTDAANNLAISKGTLTGNYTDPGMLALQKQMQENSAKWQANPNNDPTIAAQNDALHNSNIDLAKQLGQKYDPNTGKYSGGNTSIRTIAGQTLDLNNAKDMAMLTGKMPDGTPTSAQQQLDLANEWKASESTGVITPKLAQMYGLPAGMKTEQAKQFAQTLNIQQQNADSSSLNASTSAANSKNNIEINNANAFGTKDKNGNQSADYLYKQSQAARDNALAIKAGNDSQKNAIDTAYRDAVSLAQKDPKWITMTADEQASTIDKHYNRLKPTTSNGVSDSDISSYLNKK